MLGASLTAQEPSAHFSGQQRTRFESLHGQFRSGILPNSEDQLLTRTSLRGDFVYGKFGAAIEVMDSRAFHVADDGLTGTASVNTTDLVNAYATVGTGSIGDGDGRLLVGRYTMTVGSRRFIIRNVFRNTVNTFTGVDYLWQNKRGDTAHAFWTMPVRRRPFDAPSLRDNDFEWDDQDKDLQLYGVFGSRQLTDNTHLEAFVFGLHEDAPDSRNRRLITPGLRVQRTEQRGSMSYEVEGVTQVGESQLQANGATLDHSAWFAHASVGYTGDYDCLPTVRLAYDYASGDRDPNDGDNNRFDTLYGAPRFDFGPTSLWGAIQRSNFSAPELRVSIRPCERSFLMVAYRDLRLAAARDTWVGAGVRDVSGQSGKQVGRHVEMLLRYEFLPQTMSMEVGGAYLFAGSFLEREPNSRGGGDSRFGYVEMTWMF